MSPGEQKLAIDFDEIVALAREGQDVRATVQLIIRPIAKKVLAGHGARQTRDAYLLLADFTFLAGGRLYEATRTYLKGDRAEAPVARYMNLKFANCRIQRDYDQLKSAGIIIDPIYFNRFIF